MDAEVGLNKAKDEFDLEAALAAAESEEMFCLLCSANAKQIYPVTKGKISNRPLSEMHGGDQRVMIGVWWEQRKNNQTMNIAILPDDEAKFRQWCTENANKIHCRLGNEVANTISEKPMSEWNDAAQERWLKTWWKQYQNSCEISWIINLNPTDEAWAKINNSKDPFTGKTWESTKVKMTKPMSFHQRMVMEEIPMGKLPDNTIKLLEEIKEICLQRWRLTAKLTEMGVYDLPVQGALDRYMQDFRTRELSKRIDAESLLMKELNFALKEQVNTNYEFIDQPVAELPGVKFGELIPLEDQLAAGASEELWKFVVGCETALPEWAVTPILIALEGKRVLLCKFRHWPSKSAYIEVTFPFNALFDEGLPLKMADEIKRRWQKFNEAKQNDASSTQTNTPAAGIDNQAGDDKSGGHP